MCTWSRQCIGVTRNLPDEVNESSLLQNRVFANDEIEVAENVTFRDLFFPQ
jgi:hypothetical protein